MPVLALVMLLMALAVQAADVKPVYQETDASAECYMANRRALVGAGCVVNSLFDGVKVVGGVTGLQNLVDEDLDNYAVMPSLADVGVAVEPLVSVKDMEHAYAAGTQAGFSLEAASGSSLLTLDVSQFYRIWFYRDGEKVGEASVEQGQDVKGLSLSLIQIPGNDDFCTDIVATAPEEFDEIKLVKAGVDVSALGSVNIRYAFVGKAREYTLTQSGIKDYSEATGREVTVEGHGLPGDLLAKLGPADLVDDDLTNGYVVETVLAVGSSLPASVVTDAADGEETFKAGTEVGFVYTNTTGLELGVASSITLTLYDTHNNKVGEYPVSTSVLGLGVVSREQGGFAITAPVDFSSAKILFPTLLKLTLGDVKVNYAFVRMPVDIASHHCPIDVMADRSVCDCDNEYQLQWNHDIGVIWSVDEQPQGAGATVDAGGKVTLSVPGTYRFKATAEDGCCEYTTLGYGDIIAYEPQANGEHILVNSSDDAEPKYELSDERGGGLIQLSSGVRNRQALLDEHLRDYSYLTASVDVAGDRALAGVRSVDGSNLADGFSGSVKAGFVVATKGTALSADVLDMFNIRLYKDGQQVASALTRHWSAVGAGLIGSGQEQKMRFSIDVPAGIAFDEMVLWKSGVLGASLSQMNIYYAFVDDGERTIPSEDGLYNAEVISHEGTHASIDFENTSVFSVANIGNGVDNISHVIDGDLTTGVDFPLGANLGGAKLAVNMGCIAGEGQQLVVVMDKVKLGLGVELGNALKVETWLGDEKQEELTSWKVLGADIISDGGQTYAMLNPTKDFDQVRIVPMNVLGALTNIKLYGLALRNDANGDGVPDVVDLEPCMRELVLSEDQTLDEADDLDNVRLVLHRTLATDAQKQYKWNSIVLPVSMTAAQVGHTFGQEARLATFSRVEDGWIYFKEMSRPEDDTEVMMEAGVPYLLMPSRDADLGEEAQYETLTGEVVSGPVYFTEDVNYSQPSQMQVEASGLSASGATFYGSYESPSVVPAGAYMLSRGNLVHTAVEHNVKAYRCWLLADEDTAGEPQQLKMRLTQTDGTTTDIRGIEETPAILLEGIYNLAGQRMAAGKQTLPQGIYIINGEKVIVK